MNVKPGDLAIIIAAYTEAGRRHIGKIVKIVMESDVYRGSWITDPELRRCETFNPIHWQDSHLKPVSGLPMEEETEQKLKEPA